MPRYGFSFISTCFLFPLFSSSFIGASLSRCFYGKMKPWHQPMNAALAGFSEYEKHYQRKEKKKKKKLGQRLNAKFTISSKCWILAFLMGLRSNRSLSIFVSGTASEKCAFGTGGEIAMGSDVSCLKVDHLQTPPHHAYRFSRKNYTIILESKSSFRFLRKCPICPLNIQKGFPPFSTLGVTAL